MDSPEKNSNCSSPPASSDPTSKKSVLREACNVIISSQTNLPYVKDDPTRMFYAQLAPVTKDEFTKPATYTEEYGQALLNSWRHRDRMPKSTVENRADIVEILITASIKLGLPFRATFISVSLFDRCVTSNEPGLLTALAALSLAAKSETSQNLPDVGNFLDIVENCFTSNELIAREASILSSVNLVVVSTTAVEFINYWIFVEKLEEFRPSMSFIALCTLLSNELAIYPSELVGAAVLAVGLASVGRSLKIDSLESALATFGKKKMSETAKHVVDTVLSVQGNQDVPLYRLFADSEWGEIASRLVPKLPSF